VGGRQPACCPFSSTPTEQVLFFVGWGTCSEGLNRLVPRRYQVPYPGAVLIFICREHRLDAWIYLSRTAQYEPSFKLLSLPL
jgi:hypothetical protein